MEPSARRSSGIVAIATALVLSGCAFGPSPVPTPSPEQVEASTPTPTPTPTAEPIDPLTTVTEIVVRPELLELHDAEGVVVATLSYDDEASLFMAALSTVLGAAPEQSELSGGMESAPRTDYSWDGLLATDDHEGNGPIDMNVSVVFTAPTVGDGVTVRTVNGFQPGGDAQALAAELGEPWYGNGADQVRVETGEPIGEQQPYSDYENAYSVAVNAWEWQGSSNAVFAPWNFGIGHV
ncbi:hypothetical protein J7E25_09240 [Agromyces sp. ISL-38]|uniref:hypothetical protein n=1 Tax=Agromyces sp. ISL-38 TaxID=2819107 RepID=UPI001BED2A08|nr:hypothetical protein [Agromyces sp. ISL-38]MBT2499281.1 hypothetical protein [Agromyces sp. ISL-38]